MGNTLGNKGAVGISMHIANTSFVCCNAHLAAHQHAVNQRNADFNKIARDMPTMLMKKNKGKKSITPLSSPKNMVQQTGSGMVYTSSISLSHISVFLYYSISRSKRSISISPTRQSTLSTHPLNPPSQPSTLSTLNPLNR